jgi:hypothetical protein
MNVNTVNDNVINALIRGAEKHGVTDLLYDLGAAIEAQEYLTAADLGNKLFEVLDVGRWLMRFPNMSDEIAKYVALEPSLKEPLSKMPEDVAHRDFYYILISGQAAVKYYHQCIG